MDLTHPMKYQNRSKSAWFIPFIPLIPLEWQWTMKKGRWIYRAQFGDFITSCPIRSLTLNIALLSLLSQAKLPGSYKTPLTKVMVQSSFDFLVLKALVDSWADTNLMDFQIAKRLQLSRVKLLQPLSISAPDDRLMCKVTHKCPQSRLCLTTVFKIK